MASLTMEERERLVLAADRGFYCLIPSNEIMGTAKRIYDQCVAWFNDMRGNAKGELLIELAELTRGVPAVALSGFWDEELGIGLPDGVLDECDAFVDSPRNTVRKREYLQRVVKSIEYCCRR